MYRAWKHKRRRGSHSWEDKKWQMGGKPGDAASKCGQLDPSLCLRPAHPNGLSYPGGLPAGGVSD